MVPNLADTLPRWIAHQLICAVSFVILKIILKHIYFPSMNKPRTP